MNRNQNYGLVLGLLNLVLHFEQTNEFLRGLASKLRYLTSHYSNQVTLVKI